MRHESHAGGSPSDSLSRFRRVIFLKGQSSLRAASDEQVVLVADATEEWRYDASDWIYREGQLAHHLHFIVSGRVELSRGGQVVHVLGAGELLGTAAVLADSCGYDARAVAPTLTLRLRREDVEDLWEEHFALLSGTLASVARELMDYRRRTPRAGFSEPSEDTLPPDEPLDFMGKLLVLTRTMTFAKAHIDAIADLARGVEEMRATDGEVLVELDGVGDELLIPFAGQADCTDGRTAFTLAPGSVLGALSVLAGAPHWYRAVARGSFRALRIRRDAFLDVVEDAPELGLSLIRTTHQDLLACYAALAGAARGHERRDTEPLSGDAKTV